MTWTALLLEELTYSLEEKILLLVCVARPSKYSQLASAQKYVPPRLQLRSLGTEETLLHPWLVREKLEIWLL